MAVIIRMPEVLTGMSEATLLQWFVSPGDEVSVGQPLAEVETEKAVVEFQSEEAGTLAGILINVGQSVVVGTPIAVLSDSGESTKDALLIANAMTTSEPRDLVEIPSNFVEPSLSQLQTKALTSTEDLAELLQLTPEVASKRIFMSPLVRRLAREQGLDCRRILGSGPNGRIVRRDIESLNAERALAIERPTRAIPLGTPPLVAHSESNFVDVPHTTMRRAIARRLTESKSPIPHFYLVADCRVDALLEMRRSINLTATPKISLNDLIVKAVASTLMDVPEANAVWTPEAMRRFKTVDIAIAVAIEGGLVTPVVRGVEARSISDLSRTITDLVARSRSGRLQQSEIEGGSFTISNLGMYGTQEFSAIINPPQSGILAVGAATLRPVVTNGELEVATVMTVTLSGDHRVFDGALAAQWLAALVKRIENPLSILI